MQRHKYIINIELFGTEEDFKEFESLVKRQVARFEATQFCVEGKQPTPVINKTFKKQTHFEACQKRAEEYKDLKL